MKLLGVGLILTGLVAVFIGTAIATATSAGPPAWWGWQIAGREVVLNRYALWWHTDSGDGGFWTTTILLPPSRPMILQEFMSSESRQLQKRIDRGSSAYWQEWARLDDIDRQKRWAWP